MERTLQCLPLWTFGQSPECPIPFGRCCVPARPPQHGRTSKLKELHASERTEKCSSIGLGCCLSKLWPDSRSSKTGRVRNVGNANEGRGVKKGFAARRLENARAPAPPVSKRPRLQLRPCIQMLNRHPLSGRFGSFDMPDTRRAATTTWGQRRSNHCLVILGHVLVISFFSAPRGVCCVGRIVVLCRLNCAESLFRCFCASSWRSRSVLEMSASVVAKDSTLVVTVFTRFSSDSAFFGVEHLTSKCLPCCVPLDLCVEPSQAR